MKKPSPVDLNHQGANALLAAAFEFLRRNRVSARSIVEFTRRYHARPAANQGLRLYRELVRTYDDIGVIMATWFSDPVFLDAAGRPRPLSLGKGMETGSGSGKDGGKGKRNFKANETLSVASLIRASGARVKPAVALDLMRQSPSVKFSGDGMVYAMRRVFVLPKFEVPRAAFVVERYLDTLQQNVLARRTQTPLLLERSCYVSNADLTTIAPMLRDIDSRGTAFMDAVDGEIEELRLRRAKPARSGELGVLVFAWAQPKQLKARLVKPRGSKQPGYKASARANSPKAAKQR